MSQSLRQKEIDNIIEESTNFFSGGSKQDLVSSSGGATYGGSVSFDHGKISEMYIYFAVAAILIFIGLYFTAPSFIMKEDKGKKVINKKKYIGIAGISSAVVCACIYYFKYKN